MSAFLLSIGTIAFSQGSGLVMDAWKVQGNNVLKKDTVGNVGIGTLTPQEKLHVKGDVRIDGLKGSGERWLTVDNEGKLKAGGIVVEPPDDIHRGGKPDILPPDTMKHDGGGPDGSEDKVACQPQPKAWVSPGVKMIQLCNEFDFVGIGTNEPTSRLHLRSGSPSGKNVLLKLSNIHNFGELNEPSIQFDNNESSAIPIMWKIGARVTGLSYFRISHQQSNDEKELFRINEYGMVGIGTNNPTKMLHILSLRNSMNPNQNGLRLEDKSTTGVSAIWDMEPFYENGLLKINNHYGGVATEVMNFTKEGNVGIGTSNPKSKLHLFGTSPLIVTDMNVLLRLSNKWESDSKSNEPSIVFDNNGDPATVKWYIGAKVNVNHYFRIGKQDGETYKEFLRIDNNGKVGIGTNNPKKALHVYTVHGTPGGVLGSHNGIRLEDYNFNSSATSAWDIEPDAGGDKPLSFSFLNTDGTKRTVLSMSSLGLVKLDGELCLKAIKCTSTEPPLVKNNINDNVYFFVGVGNTKTNSLTQAVEPYAEIGAFENSTPDPYWRDLILQRDPTWGNVGIGTIDPQYKLHVAGDVKTNGKLIADGNIETKGAIKLIDGTTTTTITAATLPGLSNYWQKNVTDLFYDKGNVSIGSETNPTVLEIFGKDHGGITKNSISISSSSTGSYIDSKLGTLYINTNNNHAIVIGGTVDIANGLTIDNGIYHVCTNNNTCSSKLTNPEISSNYGFLHLESISSIDPDMAIMLETKNSVKWAIIAQDNDGSLTISKSGIKSSLKIYENRVDVCGVLNATEVNAQIINGCDFVFEPSYSLLELNKVEEYISNNKHLPEIPSATEMETKGIMLGKMFTKLLQKIEEIFLYLFQINKRINTLETINGENDQQIKILNQKNKELELRLEIQEKKLDHFILAMDSLNRAKN